MAGIDHYALLGVRSDASALEIRRAYRRLARLHHPDVNPRPDGHGRFAQLARAYAILNDPTQRARYDQTLHRSALANPPNRPRVPVRKRSLDRGILELSLSEAGHLAQYPLRLRDSQGRLIVLPAGTGPGDEIIVPYNGRPVVLRVHVQGKP